MRRAEEAKPASASAAVGFLLFFFGKPASAEATACAANADGLGAASFAFFSAFDVSFETSDFDASDLGLAAAAAALDSAAGCTVLRAGAVAWLRAEAFTDEAFAATS
ncbi:MAG: hypothetical protein CFK52_00195 [Chloracidobacterium sp. CP2_5A]|nr:MAG: hypothetical protein CFK52_00195 [Chloracidobacterium sp. CP2_5A]